VCLQGTIARLTSVATNFVPRLQVDLLLLIEVKMARRSNSRSNRPQEASISKECVEEGLDNGRFLALQKTGSNSNDIWENFMVIFEANSEISIGFVKCVICSALLKYKSCHGVSSLKRHAQFACRKKTLATPRINPEIRKKVT